MKTYKKLTQIEHILKRPGMYIGSTDKVVESMDIFEDNKIINKENNLPFCLFIELLGY